MRIAYIISAYTDPENLKRLVDALGNQTFFVHVDKNVSDDPFTTILKENRNVVFLQNRVRVSWGGYSQVEYQKRLLQEVRRTGPYDRVVCLTGTDYPAMSASEIESIFKKEAGHEFLRAECITGNNKQSSKVKRYWKFDYNIKSFIVKRIARGVRNRVIGRFLYQIGIKKQDVLNYGKMGGIWKIYFGSDYWGLTYDCAMMVLDKLENDIRLYKYFKSAYAPSELVIPTIVCNSLYAVNVDKIYDEEQSYENLCALHYLIYDPLVRVMTEENYDDIIKSGKMFFRKAKTGESNRLIQMLSGKNEEKNESVISNECAVSI